MLFKRRIILIYVLVAYIFISLGIHLGFNLFNHSISLLVGVILMVISIPIHLQGKKLTGLYFLTFIVNVFGLGLSIASYYEYRGALPSISDFIKVSVITFTLIAFFGAITFPKRIKPYVKIFAVIVILILFITSIVLWVKNDELIYSLFFYFLNTTYFFMVGMITASRQLKDLSREMSFVSFGAFIFVSVIVLIIVSEGEALEGVGEAIIEGIGETIQHVIPNRKKIQ